MSIARHPFLIPVAALSALCSFAGPAPAQNAGIRLVHGVDGYIEIPFAPELVPTAITVEAWVTYDDTSLAPGNAWPTVFRQNSAPGQESYFLRVQAGGNSNTVLAWVVQGTLGRANVSWTFTSGQLLPWTHLAGTYDGTTARLFVNGQEVGNAGGGGRIINRGGSLRIGDGDLSAPGAEAWNGEIDEVRLWPFARTAGEIQSTMSLQIARVPGLVSTWNLGGTAQDSSGTQHGTPTGAIQFVGNTLQLQLYPFSGATAFGGSSRGCRGPIPMSISALPRIGNADFAWMCTRVASNANGALLTSFARLQNPLRVFGIDIWPDPSAGGIVIPSASDARGVARVPLAIPGDAGLVGGLLYDQFVWVDPCGSMGLTASDGLVLNLLR